MTEHESGNQPNLDQDSHSNRVIKTGTGQRAATGITCDWELHALQIYQESDGALSQKLLDQVAQELQNRKIDHCKLKVADGYDDEDPENPHYSLEGKFNQPDDSQLEQTTASIGYTMIETDGTTTKGSITITVDLPADFDDPPDFLTVIFTQYDSLMLEYYSDLPTTYNDGGLQFERL